MDFAKRYGYIGHVNCFDLAIIMELAVLGGVLAVPCTRNPL